MVNVKGKWALITGASRGIGYLTALFMAEQGCNLVLHSRTKEHCDKVLKEVKEKGVEAYAVEAELTDLAQVEKMLADIDAKETPVSIVLNNAGLQIAYRTDYLNTPASDYTESFKINTIAPAMICYHFLPKMIANGFGRILNTTSGIRLDPHATNAPESAIPGIVVGVFADDKKSGRNLGAQAFTGMTLEEAVAYAEANFDSPY